MTKALGEFGLSKNAAVISKIMQYMDRCTKPVDVMELWGIVHQDIERPDMLAQIVGGLIKAGKLTMEGSGLLPRREVVEMSADEIDADNFLDWSYLSSQEREVIK